MAPCPAHFLDNEAIQYAIVLNFFFFNLRYAEVSTNQESLKRLYDFSDWSSIIFFKASGFFQVLLSSIRFSYITVISVIGNFGSPINLEVAKWLSIGSCALFTALMLQILVLIFTHLAR